MTTTDKTPWLLVTGLPRSGSTFVGTVLSTGLTADYIHEPFNPSCGIGTSLVRYPCLDPDVRDAEHDRMRAMLSELRGYRVRFRTPRYPEDTALRRVIRRAVGGRGQFHYRIARLNPFTRHVVVKDPTAFLMAEFLADEGRMTPVVVLRHPLSWIGAWQRTGWDPELEILRARDRFVHSLTAEEADLLGKAGPPEVQLACFWRLGYGRLLSQATRNGWPVLRLEEASESPMPVFRRLFEASGLPWSDRVERKVQRMTSGRTPDGPEGQLQHLRRDSARIFQRRRNAVPQEFWGEIRTIVQDVADPFYPEESYA